MKRVLIITYYWPPAGGVSAQRWLKFVKYLPENGWKPIIFTAKDADYPLLDHALVQQIPDCVTTHRIPFFEPRTFVKKYFQKEKTSTNKKDNLDGLFYIPKAERTWKQNLMLWTRANFFIPDARMFWIRPSVQAIIDYLNKNPVDIIVSTGPPHSAHLIGRAVKKQTGVKWLADFRDPWTFMENFATLPFSERVKKKHFELEKAVIQEADGVTIVSESWRDEYAKLHPKRIEVLHNGYDLDDFSDLEVQKNPEQFVISHIGTFQEDRNPIAFWKAIKQLTCEDSLFAKQLKIQLVGNVDRRVLDAIQKEGLGDYLQHVGVVQHQQALQYMLNADVLLLIINQSEQNAKGRLTAKLYEYIATGNAIWMLGPSDSDAGRVVASLENGMVLEPIKKDWIARAFHRKTLVPSDTSFEMYDRKNLTQKLSAYLDSIID